MLAKKCSKGWFERCSNSKGDKCNCKCLGENHRRQPEQTSLFDLIDSHDELGLSVKMLEKAIALLKEQDQRPNTARDAYPIPWHLHAIVCKSGAINKCCPWCRYWPFKGDVIT